MLGEGERKTTGSSSEFRLSLVPCSSPSLVSVSPSVTCPLASCLYDRGVTRCPLLLIVATVSSAPTMCGAVLSSCYTFQPPCGDGIVVPI